MNTFKAIILPLAVVCVAVAVLLPPTVGGANRWPRWVLAAVGAVLAFIALFVSADAVA